jgi:protein KRI1
LADHHRAALLNGKAGDDQEEDQPLTHVESQYRLRNEAVSAFKALADDEDDGDEDEEAGGLVKREREEAAIDVDDEEYRRFLLEMGGGEEEVRKILGMGDQPIKTARVSDEEDEGTALDAGTGVKPEKKKKKKSAKSQERKAKQDDEFLMK